MDVYKAKIKSDGSLDKLKLIIVVRGYLQDMELVGYTCSSTASISTLEYFLADEVNHKYSCRLLMKKCVKLVPYFADLL